MTRVGTPIDSEDPLGHAVSQARQGDLLGARETGKRLLAERGETAAVHAFLGMVTARIGDFDAAATHLSAARASRPDDPIIALNLAHVLSDLNRPREALAICDEFLVARAGHRALTLRAYLLQCLEDFPAAVEAYEQIVAGRPGDVEAWNNLGNAKAAAGDLEGSLAAFERASALAPDIAPLRLNHAATLVELDRFEEAIALLQETAEHFPDDDKPLIEMANIYKRIRDDEAALAALERAAQRAPDDLALKIRLGNELALAWRMDEAEALFRRVMEVTPDNRDAHSRMALVLEHTNRHELLPGLIAEGERSGVDLGAIAFSRALYFRRAKRFREGLAAVEAIAEDIEPVRRWQLAGQFHDQLGEADAAFDAFTRMNNRILADIPETAALARAYREQVERQQNLLTPAWVESWSGTPSPASRNPVFLVGFPRSGTTLLDTLLMGHPDVQVLEERPPLNIAERALGGFDAIATASEADVERARTAYFDEAAKWIEVRSDSLLVDKFPLHMTKVPLIHRLFPEARFLLALRDPRDVILSCFITNFRPNQAMANFTDLAGTARLYDISFGFWEKAAAMLPVAVDCIRYENLVDDAAAALKPILASLGLDWRDELLDHRETAAGRGTIVTASYAQVTEPIYRRAAGRWRAYAHHLEAVLPQIAPWIEKLGYRA